MKHYCYTVCDVEHPGDYQRFETSIRNGGGIIDKTEWSGEDGDNAYIHFHCEPEQLENIKQQINEIL